MKVMPPPWNGMESIVVGFFYPYEGEVRSKKPLRSKAFGRSVRVKMPDGHILIFGEKELMEGEHGQD